MWSLLLSRILHLSGTGKACSYEQTPKVQVLWWDEIKVCAKNVDTILGSIVNRSGRAYVIVKKKENIYSDLVYLLHLNSNSRQYLWHTIGNQMRQFFVVVQHTFSSSVSDAGSTLVVLRLTTQTHSPPGGVHQVCIAVNLYQVLYRYAVMYCYKCSRWSCKLVMCFGV